MRPIIHIFLLTLLSFVVESHACGLPVFVQQDSLLVLRGRVLCNGRAVPYAMLQVCGSSVGVLCNDAGEYELRLAQSRVHDTVVVRSMGYVSQKKLVAALLKNGDVSLDKQVFELKRVEVSDFRSPQHLIIAAVERIASNYQQRTAWSTFFYRDWRAVDSELYLFDEAVMSVRRSPYSQYADKRSYILDPSKREMESNLKTILRHRLVVYDRRLLETKISKSRGCDQMMVYSDNEDFFDPVATPQASYALASRMLRGHSFGPVRTFSAGDDEYWLVTSVGPCRTSKARVRYEYTIRKSDLAIVRIVASKQPVRGRAPAEAWVNVYYNSMTVEKDSSLWTYDVRDGRLTLTRYFNTKSYRLESHGRGHDGKVQRWQQCHDWILTDFSLSNESDDNPLGVPPQPLPDTFGNSDFDSGFWGHYNTVPIDSLPLQLLKEKFHIP